MSQPGCSSIFKSPVFFHLCLCQKKVRLVEHCHFNQTCQGYRTLPKHLQVKPLVQSPKGRRIAIASGFKFLSARIHCNWKTHDQIVKEFTDVGKQLSQALSPELLSAVVQYSSKSQVHASETCRKRILRRGY